MASAEPDPLAGPMADPLAGLYGFRLPPDMPLQALADSAAALGVGLALAALLAPLLLRLTRQAAQRKSGAPDHASRIAALRDQPDDIRVPALLSLLQARAPEAAGRYRADLYRPGGLPDPEEIEQALREAG